ncbi:prephenate dehydrogenase/arogenate dehydrogenase family protein [Streptomyces fildesensis]|uniref:Prephenate dehydrogenase/arogenate dehydrogenase family protein n=1 Tax=Streptomyces fildesensis TaxID=375757 RepID=A0ABW8CJ34_9ACTN
MRTVAVVGGGLIGTSIGMDLHACGVRVHVIDRDPVTQAVAAERCRGYEGAPPEPADLAVIAVPPGAVAPVLREWQSRGLARCYTDVASAKESVHRAATAAGCALDAFVGGHPMAGSERPGPYAARAGLFTGRPWVLTPDRHTGTAALSAALALVEACGARLVVMGRAEHDRAVATTSHAPHVVASALASAVGAAPQEVVELCGAGIRDATRIAAGETGLWSDILGSNASAVAAALEPLITELTDALVQLRAVAGAPPGTPPRALAGLLDRGGEGRARIMTAQPAAAPAPPPVAVPSYA